MSHQCHVLILKLVLRSIFGLLVFVRRFCSNIKMLLYHAVDDITASGQVKRPKEQDVFQTDKNEYCNFFLHVLTSSKDYFCVQLIAK